MNDERIAPASFRATLAFLVSLALILSPWPAWAQVVRVAVPEAAAGAASAAAGVAPISGSFGALSAPALLAAASAPLPAAAPALVAPVSAAAAFASGAAAPSAEPAPAAAAAPAAPTAPAPPAFATEASVRGKTVVMVGTKSSRPFIMAEAARVARALGLTLVVVDDADHRENSKDVVPDDHFIAAPIGARDEASLNAVADAVAAHPIGGKADVVTSFMSLYANVTARVTDRLGAAGIPGAAVAAADDKPSARRLLNADPALAVPFSELTSEEQTRAAYREVSDGGRYKVVIKTIRGENSRFLALGLDSEEAAAKAYTRMDADVKAFVERPEAKQTTFSSHPGIMMERMIEKLPGTEETSVEVVMQRGKPAFAIVSDTQGIGHNKELAGGILVFPSQQPESAREEMIEASGRALKALGIEDGNARLDMMMTKDGPRVIEINPLMGSVAIWKVVHSLTGM
ncbi:MAG TPA: hypothetical protein VH309_12415, partial [Elusimicrobiota bacterium]|nr:hypothetical protein [Elusimicrobiota bacterium]